MASLHGVYISLEGPRYYPANPWRNVYLCNADIAPQSVTFRFP